MHNYKYVTSASLVEVTYLAIYIGVNHINHTFVAFSHI